ncbi:putative RNase H-like nuclease [Catenuloplanes nepalensis]|uniref:RNase H-like nuclease n=1 Tax=Catenuloplanes nepalensis TaxID=587533 RepID=A0ABT9MLV1_9ACTN|nr:DUF429 domain-containing protein [Catenuloplanes nepalensis]MDP9792398.1 putative RNase H-like nuclease [Catenuloplanes nepalensis]
MPSRVLGADAYRGGWVGVLLAEDEGHDHPLVLAAPGIADLVAQAGPRLDVIGVDIPIGLPDTTRRRADTEARRQLGPRASSVFFTPVRAALTCTDYAAANAENRRRAGEGMSAQAYRLGPRILDVDAWLRGGPRPRTVEVHPELSFARMAGAPLPDSKKTWSGTVHREELLRGHGIRLPRDIGPAGRVVPVDDVLDAAAAAWTARRAAAGEADRVPADPEVFSDGLPAAIWA